MAASRIKGITVEVGGDTTKLQTALKGVNSEIKNTQAQLKDVNKLLKLDPGNTELLAQKHKLLGDAVGETKEKLETLKTAAEQANTALANGDISQEQYDALQREIVETENELKNLETQANESATALQKISATGEKLQTVGGQISSVGQSLLPVSAAVTGLGVAGLKVASDFETGMSEVKAITGFGLAASDSTRVADLLTQAANGGTIDIEDLGESFKYVAPVCSAMGFSIEDATTALAAMSTAGIKGSQAGTSLRTAFLNMASPTDAVAAAMDKIGLTVTDANGNFKDMDTILSEMRSGMEGMTESEKENVIATIAGKNAVSGLMSIVNMSQEDYDAMAASMDNCSGVAEQTAAVMQDNLQSKIEQLGGALESLAIKLADYVIPFLTSLVEKITSAVEWFTNLDPTIQKVILVIGGIVAVAGPLLIIIGKVVSAVGTIMTIVPKVAGVIKTVQTAFAALNATMLANPIVLIIAAIAALVAAFVYLWNTNEDFRQFWIDLWENIKEVAVTVWNAIKDFFVAAWEAISTTAQTIWNAISTFFSTVWNGIKTIITTVVTAIQTFLTTAWNTIKTVITTVLNAIKTVFTTVWNGIKSVITTVVNGIKTTITTVWNGIKSTISSVMNTIKSTISTVFNNVWSGIKNTMGKIVSTIKDGFNQAITFITSLPSKALQWGKDIINGIVDGIKSCIGKVKDAVSNVASTITSFLHFSVPDEGPLTDYESWMPDFMAGLAKGIEDSRGMVAKAMDGVAADMVISPSLSAATADGGSYNSSDTSSIISAIQTAFAGLQTSGGDTVIPVYIGGTMLDEIVVNAQQRVNLRSGGR